MGYTLDRFQIGSRIREERKKRYRSQERFADALQGCGYKTSREMIAKWESGADIPNYENLLMLCDLFNCDMEYLLGRQSERTKEIKSIRHTTGLSLKASEKLSEWYQTANAQVPVASRLCQMRIAALDMILSSDGADNFLEYVHEYATVANASQGTVEKTDSEGNITDLIVFKDLKEIELSFADLSDKERPSVAPILLHKELFRTALMNLIKIFFDGLTLKR